MTNKLQMVSIRLVKDAPLMSETPIKQPIDAVKLIGKELCQLDREVLCVINLKASGIPINCNIVSVGTLDQSLAHPREMLKSVILSNAANIIVVHSHPSGLLAPSKYDTLMTDKLNKLCDLMDIKLLDHIIVGGDNKDYFSFSEHKIMDYPRNTYETDFNNIELEGMSVAEQKKENRIRRSR